MSALDLRALAGDAWERYQAALRALAQPSGAQLDLLELSDASTRAREWRGIWCACEREQHRLETSSHA